MLPITTAGAPNQPVMDAFPAAPNQYADIVNTYARKKALLDALRTEQLQNNKRPDQAATFNTQMPGVGQATSLNLGGLLANAAKTYTGAVTDKQAESAQSDADASRYDALMKLVGGVPAGQELNQAQNIALSQMGLDPTKFDPAARKQAMGGGTSGVMQEYQERIKIANDPNMTPQQKTDAIKALDTASNQFRILSGSNGFSVANIAGGAPAAPVMGANGATVLPVPADVGLAERHAAAGAYGTGTGTANATSDLTVDNAAVSIPRMEQAVNTLQGLSKSWLGNSGLGGDVANAAAYVGIRPKSVQDQQAAAGTLDQLAVGLAPFATKFSGAQSDTDVQNYTKQMGIVTDKNAGIDKRIAAVKSAIDSIKQIQVHGLKGPSGRLGTAPIPLSAVPPATPAPVKLTDDDIAKMDPNAPGLRPENAAIIRAAKLRVMQRGATK